MVDGLADHRAAAAASARLAAVAQGAGVAVVAAAAFVDRIAAVAASVAGMARTVVLGDDVGVGPAVVAARDHPVVAGHLQPLAVPGIHVVQIGAHQAVADHEVAAAAVPAPADDEGPVVGDHVAHLGLAQRPAAAIGGHRPVIQDVFDGAGRAPVVVPVVAGPPGHLAAIVVAEVVPAGHGAGVLGDHALGHRVGVIAQTGAGHRRPAPLALLLGGLGYGEHLGGGRPGAGQQQQPGEQPAAGGAHRATSSRPSSNRRRRAPAPRPPDPLGRAGRGR